MSFYATANLQNIYKQDYVSTASPVELIVMLYEGCIKQLKLAKIHNENGDAERTEKCFEKAEDIILELIRSLNLSIPISDNLLSLYQFMVDELVQASMKKDMDRVEPVIEMLSSLSEAWSEVKRTAESGMYTQE